MSARVLGGRYQVQDKIGAGGMATVYRGLDEVLGRTVAIKTMLPQYANDPSFAARFKQEAQAAAALQSPYIVSVYDWGKDADTYYIVMEYLRGTDLKSGIRKHGALDCKKVAQIGSQIAQALSVAHKHDIIHRDIKPQNIMVQPDGNIKVMDFGIARAKNSHLTQDNSVLGTAHYVSPEQTQGKELGPTTDIYSLGIVMYEAATGQVPFQGDDAISVALKQVNEQPKPPSQLNPSVDPSLESIILKCMQKNPADRFQTADELYRTLRDYLAGRMQAVNSATAMLPAQPTNKLERGAAALGGTASMPRVERTNRYRGQSATEQAAEQEAERARKRKRNIAVGVVIGVIALAIAVFAIANLVGSAAAQRTVPSVIGMTQDEAEQAIKDAGFDVGQVSQGYSSDQPEGSVYEQSPDAYTQAEEGSKISFRVSQGPQPAEQVEVPDLSNLTEQQAQEELASRNLRGRAGAEQESDDVEAGRVCDQDTEPGTMVDVNTTITYYLSSGAAQEVVPNVEGDTADSAESRLTAAGFTVTRAYANSSSVAYGLVISTNPSIGSTVASGSNITITISQGPAEVDLPNVVGKDYLTARSQLQALGFSVSLASGSSADGVVTAMSPSGSSAPAGASIVLTTQVQQPSEPSTPDTSGGSGSETGTGTSTGTGSGSGSGSSTGTSTGNGEN